MIITPFYLNSGRFVLFCHTYKQVDNNINKHYESNIIYKYERRSWKNDHRS